MRDWELSLLEPLLFVLQVENLGHIGHHNLEIRVCESLPKTDTHATAERRKTASIALFAARGETQLTVGVETLRDKVVWALPFAIVHVESIDMMRNDVSLLELIGTKLAICFEA